MNASVRTQGRSRCEAPGAGPEDRDRGPAGLSQVLSRSPIGEECGPGGELIRQQAQGLAPCPSSCLGLRYVSCLAEPQCLHL